MFYIAAAAIALTSCTSEETVDLDDSGTISFRVAMGAGANSRGLETTTDNLNEFKVCAVVRGQADHYIEKQTFKKNTSGVSFTSTETYRWPEDNIVDFYAYTYYPGKTGETDNNVDYTKFGINLSGEAASDDDHKGGDHKISFTPATDITEQIDPVTAWAAGSEATTSSGVTLNFTHILSQIQIKAVSSSHVYEFSVKGVRIKNAKSAGVTWSIGSQSWSGDLETPQEYSYKDFGKVHGLNENQVLTLGDKAQYLITEADPAMLLPQKLTKWDYDAVKKGGTSDGAYISVLLRITMNNGAHVVFPDTKHVKYDEDGDGYAWANIPIDTEWKAGNRYVYTLDFSYGAGYDDGGERILGDQILFTTSVSNWNDAEPVPVAM